MLSCQGCDSAGEERLWAVWDSMIRNKEIWFCHGYDNCMMTCLPGAQLAIITHQNSWADKECRAGACCTNDIGGRTVRQMVLEASCRVLGRMPKARISKGAFSTVLPVSPSHRARETGGAEES